MLPISAAFGRWITLIATFVFGQGCLQAIQLLTGFFIINCMAQEAYASYTLLIAIYTTTSVLVGLGITQSLLALIGEQSNKPTVIGSYIRACQYYRFRLLLIASVALAIVLFSIASHYEWPVSLTFLAWTALVGSLTFYCIESIYLPVLLLKERLKSVYKIGIGAALTRLLLLILLFQCWQLSVSATLLVGTLYLAINSLSIRKLAEPYVVLPSKNNDLSAHRAEVRAQTLPKAPGFAFFAFEGQIGIFLISIFGSTGEIAEVGVLGRLGMLFAVIYMSGKYLIAPAFAKLPPSKLIPTSALTLGIGLIIGITAIILTAQFPKLVLLPLGGNYSHLQTEALILILACSIRILDVFAYSICLSRKYVYSWYPFIDILPVLTAMVVCITLIDLDSTRRVLEFTAILSIVRLVSKLVVLHIGLRRELRANAY